MIWDGTAQRPTVKQRRAHGKSLRDATPRSSHSEWAPGPDRADAVALIESQNDGRIPGLVPVRRWRMSRSAFAFYRGAAIVMASDLATTPSTGLTVQACGDAHLSNFGGYASPERDLVFDVNDFDETLTGPWEWDLKRLATSFVIAGRHLELDEDDIETMTKKAVAAYRTSMLAFAEMRTLDVWYAKVAIDDLLESLRERGKKKVAKRGTRAAKKARSRDSLQALSKLAHTVDGRYQINSDPPVLVPLRDFIVADPDDLGRTVRESFAAYRASLRPDRRLLLDRFTPIDIAIKVVGVGSVGTRSLVLLLEGRDREDPLFLQIKEAGRSVLERHLAPSRYENHGERVVQGQRLSQASSDIFLGWSPSLEAHDYYWRQLRDWKYSFDIEDAGKKDLGQYAIACGHTLARSHARTGDPIAIAGYLGKSGEFDGALTTFAGLYADQNERDYRSFTDAIERGELLAREG